MAKRKAPGASAPAVSVERLAPVPGNPGLYRVHYTAFGETRAVNMNLASVARKAKRGGPLKPLWEAVLAADRQAKAPQE